METITETTEEKRETAKGRLLLTLKEDSFIYTEILTTIKSEVVWRMNKCEELIGAAKAITPECSDLQSEIYKLNNFAREVVYAGDKKEHCLMDIKEGKHYKSHYPKALIKSLDTDALYKKADANRKITVSQSEGYSREDREKLSGYIPRVNIYIEVCQFIEAFQKAEYFSFG